MKTRKFTLLAALLLMNGASYGAAVTGNQFGQGFMLSGTDLSTIQQSAASTFGTVTAIETMRNGNLVIGNSAGGLYVVNPSAISTVLYSTNIGVAISHLSVQSDNSIVIGNAANSFLYRRSSTLGAVGSGFSFLDMGAGMANFTAMTLQSNDNIVLGAANGNIQIRSTAAGAAEYTTFSTYTGLSAIGVRGNDGLWVTSSTSGFLWNLNSNLTSGGTTQTGFAAANLIGLQNDGDLAILDSTNGYLWFRNADGSAKAGGFMTGFGTASGIAFDDQDQAYIVSTGGAVWLRDANMAAITSRSGFGTLNDIAVIPEPTTLVLLVLAGSALILSRRRHSSR